MRVRATCSALLWLLATGCRDDDTTAMSEDTDGAGETGEPGDDDDDAADGDSDEGEDVEPPPGGLRRLLAHEYVASIEQLLGSEAAAAATPPADPTVGDYDAVAAIELPVAPTAVADHEASARAVAAAAVAAPEVLAQTVPCVVDGPQDESCYASFIRDMGRLLWRRPLEDVEVAALLAIAEQARTWGEGEFSFGIEYALATMLQSPSFVYVVEVGEPDDGGARRLTPHELATRMSLFLLGRTPDAELLATAERGGLDEPDAIRDVAWSLVDRPRAQAQVDRFFTALLGLRGLADTGKDAERFPIWDEYTAASAHAETLSLIRDLVFEQDADVLEMLDASYTFVDARVATIYGIQPP